MWCMFVGSVNFMCTFLWYCLHMGYFFSDVLNIIFFRLGISVI